MKLRRIVLAGMILMLVTMGAFSATQKKITLKLGVQDAGYGIEHWEYIIKTFEAKYPNVKIEMTASPDIGTLVSTLAQAGDNEKMFDLFMGYDPYAQAGLLEPLNDLLNMPVPDNPSSTLKNSLYLNVADMILPEGDGNVYRIPKAMYIGGLFYDKKLFDEKGWNTNPKNYKEFFALMQKIKNDGYTPMTFAGIYNYLYFTVGWHKAFEIAEEDGTLASLRDDFVNYKGKRYNNAAMLEVYNKIYEMGKAGFFDSGVPVLDHTQSQMQVIQRKVALVSSADWIDNEMKKAVPAGFEWGYMAMPLLDKAGGSIYVNAGGSDSLVIWKAKPAENKEWAKKFILWTYTVDAQKKTAEVAKALPVITAFYKSPANMANLVSAQKSIFAYMNNNKVVLETNFTKRPKVGPSDELAEKIFVEGVPQICIGAQTPEKILNEAQKYFEMGLKGN